MTGTPELIRAIGEALFGSRWQTDLGEHLEVNRRTVQRWLAGQDEPRPGVWQDLETLLSERAAAAMRLCETLRGKRAAQPHPRTGQPARPSDETETG